MTFLLDMINKNEYLYRKKLGNLARVFDISKTQPKTYKVYNTTKLTLQF